MPQHRFACLVSQYPAINHAVMLREIVHLRSHFEIHTASIRNPDRPLDRLTPEERQEAGKTFYVKKSGAAGAFESLFATLASRPFAFFAGLFYAIKLAGFKLDQVLRNVAYFVEAVMIGRWMQRLQLHHLYTHYSSTIALLVHKIFGIPISMTLHGPDEFVDPAGFWIREKVAASTFVRAISHFACSQAMSASAVADWGKIEPVYLGVNPDNYPPRTAWRTAAPLEVLCVGRLAPVKAHQILIEAIDLLVCDKLKVRLHLAGDGSTRQALESEVAKRGLRDHVIFHGWVQGDQLLQLYRDTDLFAMPSFAEGVPVVLMEAMAMEIPCVSTWITGIPELIRDGVDGLLFAPADCDALAAAIRKMVADPELRQRLGQAGRRRVLDMFDIRKNSDILANMIRKHFPV